MTFVGLVLTPLIIVTRQACHAYKYRPKANTIHSVLAFHWINILLIDVVALRWVLSSPEEDEETDKEEFFRDG